MKGIGCQSEMETNRVTRRETNLRSRVVLERILISLLNRTRVGLSAKVY